MVEEAQTFRLRTKTSPHIRVCLLLYMRRDNDIQKFEVSDTAIFKIGHVFGFNRIAEKLTDEDEIELINQHASD